MSPWILLFLTGLLLVFPWYLLGAAARRPQPDVMPEIQGPLRALYRVMKLYCIVWHQLRIDSSAPLPQSGPAILISNHTCGIDHMLLQVSSHRLLGFMIAREYFESRWLRGICSYIGCIPVNRNGRDLAAIRAALKALENGRVLPIFPEGHIVPASGRRLDEMEPGSAYIAIRARVPVVPAYIIGTPQTNEIASSLLTPSRSRVIFGQPIDLSDIPPEEAGDKSVQALVSDRFRIALVALQARAIAEQDRVDSPSRRFRGKRIVNVRGIDEVLARYPPRYHPLAAPEFLGGAGGLSGARFWRFRAGDGLLVLRAWPSDGPIRPHLEQVHRWLALTVGLGFIPRPIPDRGGRTLQEYDGRFWELTPWLPGETDRSRPPASGRLRSAFTALAALHERLAVERCEGYSTGLVHRYQSTVHLTQGGLDTLEQAVARACGPHDGQLREIAIRWVGLARIVAPRLLDPLRESAGRITTLQPCLRDARPEHFLFEGDRVSGVVDFGAMGVDCVAGDLSRLIGESLDGDRSARTEALTAYESVRPLEVAEAALIGAFESSSALLIGEHWIRWHYVEGRRFDDPRAVPSGIARGLQHLERLAGEGRMLGDRGSPS